MRDFFLQLMKDLKSLTGLLQYEKIAAIPDRAQAQAELDAVLVPMINICRNFAFIPDSEKQRIIKASILKDPEFIGLNARKVYQYLNAVSERYFQESHHLEANGTHSQRGVSLEECSQETQKKVNEFMANLATGLQTQVAVGWQKEIQTIKREDEERLKGRKAIGYTPPTQEQIAAMGRHLQYIRENYDARTGDPLPGWIPECEWQNLTKSIPK